MGNNDVPQGNVAVPAGSRGELVAKGRAPRRSPQDQDQEIQNFISAASQQIKETQESAEQMAKLASLGFTATRLTEGSARADAAQGAFARRQQAIGELAQAAEQLRGAEGTLQSRYLHFREAIRIATPDKAIHTALGVTGRVPRDAEKLLTAVRASIKTAAEPAYAPLAQSVGYHTAGLAALTTVVDAFAASRRTVQDASTQAKEATAARNAAVKELRAFTQPFSRALRLVG